MVSETKCLIQVRGGLIHLSQKILGPNSLVQAAIPAILEKTPQSFYQETINYPKVIKVVTETLQRLMHKPVSAKTWFLTL